MLHADWFDLHFHGIIVEIVLNVIKTSPSRVADEVSVTLNQNDFDYFKKINEVFRYFGLISSSTSINKARHYV